MGCNCRNKRRPLGTGRVKSSDDGSKGGGKRGYSLTTLEGKRVEFGSKLEAQAAKVRQGGGTIRPL